MKCPAKYCPCCLPKVGFGTSGQQLATFRRSELSPTGRVTHAEAFVLRKGVWIASRGELRWVGLERRGGRGISAGV
jgi:hypothetical protein